MLLVRDGLRSGAAPAGIHAADLSRAMIIDVAEVLHDLSGVDSLVVCPAGASAIVRTLVWPDVPVVIDDDPEVLAALEIAASRGYSEAVVVVADAPDLPQMVLAKMFQALGRSAVAVAPATGGGAVAVAARLPAPAWLPHADPDSATMAADLRAAAGGTGEIRLTPAWHRIRTASDVQRLDPGLEGWEATRALLSGGQGSSGALRSS